MTEPTDAQDVLREIASTAAHDLRGAVAAVLGLAGVVRDHPDAGAELADVATHLVAAARRADAALDDLVSTARRGLRDDERGAPSTSGR